MAFVSIRIDWRMSIIQVKRLVPKYQQPTQVKVLVEIEKTTELEQEISKKKFTKYECLFLVWQLFEQYYIFRCLNTAIFIIFPFA